MGTFITHRSNIRKIKKCKKSILLCPIYVVIHIWSWNMKLIFYLGLLSHILFIVILLVTLSTWFRDLLSSFSRTSSGHWICHFRQVSTSRFKCSTITRSSVTGNCYILVSFTTTIRIAIFLKIPLVLILHLAIINLSKLCVIRTYSTYYLHATIYICKIFDNY